MVSCTQPLPLSDLNNLIIITIIIIIIIIIICVFQSQLCRMEFHFFFLYIGEKEPVAIYSRLFSILKNNAIYGN